MGFGEALEGMPVSAGVARRGLLLIVTVASPLVPEPSDMLLWLVCCCGPPTVPPLPCTTRVGSIPLAAAAACWGVPCRAAAC